MQLLAEYQARLAAQDTWGVLVVLQALDAAGKDGTIRHVMSGVNPQGVAVHSFKVPSAEELDHDYLWRYAQRLPERGEIGIFNRSHYEEVLVVRVHPENLDRQRLPERAKKGDVWKRRYREINDWERYLTENGIPDREAVPQPLKGGAADVACCGASTSPTTTGSSRPPMSPSANVWEDYQEAFSDDAVAHEHGVGTVVCDPGRSQVVRADRRRAPCSCTR